METRLQKINFTARMQELDSKSEEIRKTHGTQTIVLFEQGDYYNSYGQSAKDMASILGLSLYTLEGIDYAGILSKTSDVYFPKLIRKGHKICIFEKGQY